MSDTSPPRAAGLAPGAIRVVVTREVDRWLADVPDVPGTHTYAGTLDQLDRHVREAIILGADLPDAAEADLDLAYDYQLAEPEGR